MIKFRALTRELHPDSTMADYVSNLRVRFNNSKAERIATYLNHQFGNEHCPSHPDHIVEMTIESKDEEGGKVIYQYTKSCCDSYNKRINEMIAKAKEMFP